MITRLPGARNRRSTPAGGVAMDQRSQANDSARRSDGRRKTAIPLRDLRVLPGTSRISHPRLGAGLELITEEREITLDLRG